MTLQRWFRALGAPIVISCALAVASTPATAAPPASAIGLNSARQLSALNKAITAAPNFFAGRTSDCGVVTPMLASQPGRVMAGNFRDADGDCYVWLNLRQSSLLSGADICKLGLHEMGHLNGLEHSTDPADLMYAPFNSRPTPGPCAAAVRARVATEPTCPDTTLAPDADNLPLIAESVLCLLNVERGRAALPPLSLSTQLSQASQSMADRMIRDQFFSHNSPDGRTLLDRVRPTGYLPRSDTWAIGENLAWGNGPLATPDAIVAGWMNSPGHRANILAADFRDIGIGLAIGSPLASHAGGATYVTDFGQRSPLKHTRASRAQGCLLRRACRRRPGSRPGAARRGRQGDLPAR